MKIPDTDVPDFRQSYLLLDGALIDALKLVYTHDDTPSVDMLYRSTRHRTAIGVSPCLVKPSEHTRLWENQALWRSNGVVVEAGCKLEKLADHFRSLLSVRLPDKSLAYLRFYVPGQIRMLLSVLTPQETAAFSGVVRSWRYFDQENGWVTATVSGPGEARMAKDEGWFHLQQTHLDALGQEKYHAFLRHLARSPGLADRAAHRDKIASFVEQAQHYGFRSEANIARYMELLTRFEDSMKLPAVKAVLADTHRSASARLSQLDKILTHGGV